MCCVFCFLLFLKWEGFFLFVFGDFVFVVFRFSFFGGCVMLVLVDGCFVVCSGFVWSGSCGFCVFRRGGEWFIGRCVQGGDGVAFGDEVDC